MELDIKHPSDPLAFTSPKSAETQSTGEATEGGTTSLVDVTTEPFTSEFHPLICPDTFFPNIDDVAIRSYGPTKNIHRFNVTIRV